MDKEKAHAKEILIKKVEEIPGAYEAMIKMAWILASRYGKYDEIMDYLTKNKPSRVEFITA